MLRSGSLAVTFFLLSQSASAQFSAKLKTSDTVLQLSAGRSAPRTASICDANDFCWKNSAPDRLISFVYLSEKHLSIAWKFNRGASVAASNRVAFVYDSGRPALRLTWEFRAPADFGPVEHQITIENRDSREVWLPLEDSFDFRAEVPPSLALENFYVEKGADTPSSEGTHFEAVSIGYKWAGRSSSYAAPARGEPREIIPYALLQTADSRQNGFFIGVEFTGRVCLSLERYRAHLQVVAGLDPKPGPFRTRLAPGDFFRTPKIFLGASVGGPDAAGNILRPWIRQVLGNPDTWKNPNYPLLVNNSWGSGMQVDEPLALRMLHDSAEFGFDMFHMDAGWFREVGDWYPGPQKFPRGVAPLAEEAHRLGLKFGLWVDWAQAGLSRNPGALNALDAKVRDWLISDPPENWQPEPFKGQTIDVGLPAARDWVISEVNRIVRDNHVDMLEHDGYLAAKGCLRTDHPHAPPDSAHTEVRDMAPWPFIESSNSTDVSLHSVAAYYEIQNSLRRNHPNILLEVCSDGGRMVDFGAAAHADYFSITDTYDPLSNRRAFYDTSFVLPPAMLETYVEKWPTPRIENFRYMLRSGMMGWLSLMLDTTAWTPEQRAAASEEFRLYKGVLRPLIRTAQLFHISPRPDGVHWDAIQYFDRLRGSGALFAFRGSTDSESDHRFVLEGLEPAREYQVQFRDHSSPDRPILGRELLSRGLSVHLALPNSSEIVLLQELP